MDFELGRKSIVEWAEDAPEGAVRDHIESAVSAWMAEAE